MKIIRADFNNTELFSKEKIINGACCFYTENKSNYYYFEIKGQEATLYFEDEKYIKEVIDEFLFYSNFICCIKSSKGNILMKRKKIKLELCEVLEIQPSQFYIDKTKLENCKSWIKSPKDIMIPVADINNKIVSLDGHTRLRAAHDLGYRQVYIYRDDFDNCINSFVKEATKRNIFNILDLETLNSEDYKMKWHKFCDDFFERK